LYFVRSAYVELELRPHFKEFAVLENNQNFTLSLWLMKMI